MKKPRVIRERKEEQGKFPGDLRGLGAIQDSAPEAYLSVESSGSPSFKEITDKFQLTHTPTDSRRVILHAQGSGSYKEDIVTLFVASMKLAPHCQGSMFLGESIEFRDVVGSKLPADGQQHKKHYPHVKSNDRLNISHIAVSTLAQAGLKFDSANHDGFVGISDEVMTKITQSLELLSSEAVAGSTRSAKAV